MTTGHISSMSCLVKTFPAVLSAGYHKRVVSLSLARWSTSVHTHVYCMDFVYAYSALFFSVDFLPSDLSDKGLTVPQFASVSVVFDATVLSALQALAPSSLDAQFVTCSHHLHCVVWITAQLSLHLPAFRTLPGGCSRWDFSWLLGWSFLFYPLIFTHCFMWRHCLSSSEAMSHQGST